VSFGVAARDTRAQRRSSLASEYNLSPPNSAPRGQAGAEGLIGWLISSRVRARHVVKS
jgi:hypothetical protein